MSKIISWNVQILESYDHAPEVKVVDAVPGRFEIVFITCRTWEEAEKTKDRIEQIDNHED